MEIEEALERLRQYQSEIPRLKTLDYDNPEWPILKNKIDVVLQAAFKAHSEEWNMVNPHLRPGRGVTTEDERKGYLWELENCELGITKILDKYEIVRTDIKKQPMASRFSNRTLSCIIEILAGMRTDTDLRNLFFKHGLLNIYSQSGRLTAKKRKVNDVFQHLQHLCKEGDESAARTIESIVREALELYPRTDEDQYRREWFFQKFPDLDAALRADGFQVYEGKLVPVISSLVESAEEEALVEKLLDKHGFAIAKNHLKQSYQNYNEGNWEAANGALRSFLQDVFDQIALTVAPEEAVTKPPGGERRKLLQGKGFIDGDTEGKLVTSFFQFAHFKGPHPGISNQSDCRLRRYMAIALASYYLEKLEVFYVQSL